MKKNIGSKLCLYPSPVTVVGTVIAEKVNWMNVAHIGIWGYDKILLNINKVHYTNIGLKEHKTMSINIVNKEMLIEADYVGIVSGKKIDKSNVFEYFNGELVGAPLIKKAPICMECKIVEMHETETHNIYIVKIINTFVEESMFSENGKIDYEKVNPILFEMPNRQYLDTGKVVAKCWNIGNQYKQPIINK